MKLTIILLTTAILQVSASSYAQKITLNRSNAPLSQIIKEIRNQSGYYFFYNNSLLKGSKPVTIHVKDAGIEEVLAICFKAQPLVYELADKTVMIKAKQEPSFLERIIDRFNRIDIRGRIVGSDGSAISGATVTVKGTKQTNVTDANGVFSFNGIEDNVVLVITYIGYKTKEVLAKNNLGRIVLELSDNPLDEVQVIAYGTTSRRLSTGNVVSVKAEDIANQPVSNPLLALSGRVAGLTVTQNSGVPGAGVTVRIQGQNSISKGNDPFYVIDGVPFISQLPSNFGSILGASGNASGSFGAQNGNPFSFINPADIESIEVLKDADATAIYGSKAANGAILITTKKGKAGKTSVNMSAQQGIGRVPKFLPLLSREQYLTMRKEAYYNDGLAVPNPSIPTNQKTALNYDLSVWDNTRYTDWQEELIGGTANYSDFQGSISGGNSQTTFKINGGYHRETTVFMGNFSDVKGSAGFNLNHKTADQKFNVQVSASYLIDNNQLPTSDFTSSAITLSPIAPKLYRNDGSINWERIETNPATRDSVSTWQNPLARLGNRYSNKTNNLIASGLISYKILKGLELKANLGYNSLSQKETSLNPLTVNAPELWLTRQRTARFGNGSNNSWIAEPQLIYNHPLNKGKLELLLGSTFQQNNSSGLSLIGTGFNSDLVLSDIKSAPTLTIDNTVDAVYKYSALFGRINYNLDNKYILNLTARRDGSSRFGSENQFHNFGAAGAAWIISNEDFFKHIPSVFSFGKLRASYGTSGSDQIGDYQFMSLYAAPSGTIANAYQGAISLSPLGHGNPYLQWESTRKLQAALEVGLNKDKILFTVNYFNNTSSNQLLNYSLPISTGFSVVSTNLAATVKNSGWEFMLNADVLRSKQLNWISSVNLTVPKNKLEKFPDLLKSSYSGILEIGQPLDITKRYISAGVNPQTGFYQYTTFNSSTVAAPTLATDQNYIFSPGPALYGGFQNTISYHNFSLDFLFQFVKQQGQDYSIGSSPGGFASNSTTGVGNQPVWVLNRWQQAGDVTGIQRFTSTLQSTTTAQNSSIVYSDASYMRLKNLSVSWLLPDKWQQAAHLRNLRIFMQGQNLLTFTNYKGLDPETRSISSLPVLWTLTFGLQAGF